MKIGIVLGSIRENRFGQQVADWVMEQVAGRDDAEHELIDLKSFDVPLLTSPVHDDQRIVLVASKGGHTDHPDWYKNAIANPDVTLVVDGRSMPMHARTATAEERAELWPRVVKTYKGYAGYQRNTDREIPLLVCEPRP